MKTVERPLETITKRLTWIFRWTAYVLQRLHVAIDNRTGFLKIRPSFSVQYKQGHLTAQLLDSVDYSVMWFAHCIWGSKSKRRKYHSTRRKTVIMIKKAYLNISASTPTTFKHPIDRTTDSHIRQQSSVKLGACIMPCAFDVSKLTKIQKASQMPIKIMQISLTNLCTNIYAFCRVSQSSPGSFILLVGFQPSFSKTSTQRKPDR